jgi:hypothetical protein
MSILAVDFGSVQTRALLIDRVGGTYQLVAFADTRTTNGFPANDVTIGMDRALRALQDATGRNFIGTDGRIISPEQPDLSGADTVAITASGGRPLRAVVVGLMPEMSVASAIQALNNTYIEIADVLSLGDGRDLEGRVNTVLHAFPDVIFVTGGTDGGAVSSVIEMLRSVQLGVSLMDRRRRPTLVYAGNAALIKQVQAMFENVAEVLLAQNIRPDMNTHSFKSARGSLAEAFARHSQASGTGLKQVGQNVQPTARGYALVVEYLAKTRGERVAALDVGSAISILATATPKGADLIIRTDLGVGHNALNLLDVAGIDRIRSHLPFDVSGSEIRDYAANKTLRPATIPTGLKEFYFEQALLRASTQALSEAANLSAAPEFDTLILAGSPLTGGGSYGLSVLLALDSLNLAGVTRILTDPYGLTAALGAVSATRPEVAVQVLDSSGYDTAGTCVVVSGSPRPEKPALQVSIQVRGETTQTVTVNGGHIRTVAIPAGQNATVTAKVIGRGLEIGSSRSVKFQVMGGGVGLILDARGRPNPATAMTPGQRALWMPRWVYDVTGDEMREIPDQWLVAPVEDNGTSRTTSEGRTRNRVRDRTERRQRRGKSVDVMPDLDELLPEEDSIEELRRGGLS